MTPDEQISHWMNTATRRGEELIKANKRIAELESENAELNQKLSGAHADLAEQAVLQDPDPLAELARAAEGKA